MLEHFFGSKTRVKLLKLFFRFPERSFFVRELSRQVGVQLHGVRRELANLESLQVIQQVESHLATPFGLDGVSGSEEKGTERSKYYQLRQDSVLSPEIKALLIKDELMEEQELIASIRDKAGSIKLFILTGLFTQDTEIATDLLLVGTLKPVVVSRIIKSYEEDMDRSVRYTLMDEREFKDRREIGDRFLYTIFEAKHITIIDAYGIN